MKIDEEFIGYSQDWNGTPYLTKTPDHLKGPAKWWTKPLKAYEGRRVRIRIVVEECPEDPAAMSTAIILPFFKKAS